MRLEIAALVDRSGDRHHPAEGRPTPRTGPGDSTIMDKRTLPRERFEFDGWLADPAACTLLRPDDPARTSVKLEPKTMEVLSLLAARSGDVVAQEELERTVWAGVKLGF